MESVQASTMEGGDKESNKIFKHFIRQRFNHQADSSESESDSSPNEDDSSSNGDQPEMIEEERKSQE